MASKRAGTDEQAAGLSRAWMAHGLHHTRLGSSDQRHGALRGIGQSARRRRGMKKWRSIRMAAPQFPSRIEFENPGMHVGTWSGTDRAE
jgi:hypothetical protein